MEYDITKPILIGLYTTGNIGLLPMKKGDDKLTSDQNEVLGRWREFFRDQLCGRDLPGEETNQTFGLEAIENDQPIEHETPSLDEVNGGN